MEFTTNRIRFTVPIFMALAVALPGETRAKGSDSAVSPVNGTGFQSTYCNRQPARIGNTRYYPNGQVVSLGSSYYYPNGKPVNIRSALYYPNGEPVRIGSAYYYPNGKPVNIRSAYYYPNGEPVRIGSGYYHDNGVPTDKPPSYVTYRDGAWVYRLPVMSPTNSFFLIVREGGVVTTITIDAGAVGDIEAECG